MKLLIALKIIFITGTLAMLTGSVFVVLNQLVALIFPPVLVTALIVYGALGIFCGIAWYRGFEKWRAQHSESTEK